MGVELSVGPEHGWVLLVLVAAIIIHYFWMGTAVNQARKYMGVPYPHAYAPRGHANERQFNCIQRGAMNSIENLPGFLALLLTAGVRFPLTASAAGAVYLAGRVVYFQGYATGQPEKRLRGGFLHAGNFALIGMVLRWAAELLLSQRR